eukprot:COSAG01_NODE_630_length_14689_cov_177.423098_6_plen_205_part_00
MTWIEISLGLRLSNQTCAGSRQTAFRIQQAGSQRLHPALTHGRRHRKEAAAYAMAEDDEVVSATSEDDEVVSEEGSRPNPCEGPGAFAAETTGPIPPPDPKSYDPTALTRSRRPIAAGRPMRREPVTASRLPFAGRGGGRCRQEAETALRCASFRMHLGGYENHAQLPARLIACESTRDVAHPSLVAPLHIRGPWATVGTCCRS